MVLILYLLRLTSITLNGAIWNVLGFCRLVFIGREYHPSNKTHIAKESRAMSTPHHVQVLSVKRNVGSIMNLVAGVMQSNLIDNFFIFEIFIYYCTIKYKLLTMSKHTTATPKHQYAQ